MKKVLIGIIITLAAILIFRSCNEDSKKQSILKENSMLIEQQLKNVSKLIVTEGHFAEVYNYKDSQQLFGDLITSDKKALVVANVEAAIAYDLSQIDYELDETTKTLKLK